MTHTARKNRLKDIGNFALNLPLLFVILIPLLYTFSISVMPASEIYKNHLIPTSVNFSNYCRI